MTRGDGKLLYYNAFATNHLIADDTVAEIVKAGRTRWKIENEHNNTLKTKGYNLEHNFGHGKNHLSSLLATLNILALLFHTLLELLDQKYRLLRAHLPTRKTFFDDLRAIKSLPLLRELGPPIDLHAPRTRAGSSSQH